MAMFTRMAPKLSPRRTVADVMSAFHKAIDELSQVEKEHAAEAERQVAIADEARSKAASALNEAASARQIANKLNGLLSVESGIDDSFAPVSA